MNRQRSYIFTFIFLILGVAGLFTGIFSLFPQFFPDDKKASAADDYSEPWRGNVMYISSYDPIYSPSVLQMEGLKRSFSENHIFYEIFYMDMKNYDSAENAGLFYEALKFKIKNTKMKFDAVVVSDDAALHFAEQYYDELFSGMPVVFFCVNDLEYAYEVGKNPLITGAGEKIFLEETLDIAVEQNPKMETVVAIVDDSISGRGDRAQFWEVSKKYPNLEYREINLSHLSPDELWRQLRSVSENSVMICLSYLQDYAHEHFFSTDELVHKIQECAGVIPVYRTNSIGIGAGFAGGKLFDYENEAYRAGNKVADIINGAEVSEIPVDVDNKGCFVFDYSILENQGLKIDALPKGTQFVNKPMSFFEKYKDVIFPFSTICVSLIMLLGVLFFSYRKTKDFNGVIMDMNKEIRRSNQKLVESQKELSCVANRDNLTGLPNRAAGERGIREIIESGIPFSLFLIDVDDFKTYNDTYTHACGDLILREYGHRLLKLTENNEYFAARYGGDEFILVHKCDCIEPDGAEIEMLRRLMNEPVYFNNMKIELTATMGYADSKAGTSYDDLVVNADIAMYEGKKQGKGRIVAFTPDMKEVTIRKNKIFEILKEECTKGGFEIRYQPQVNVQSGDVYGFEALVRLQNYSIGPGDFIPVAENSGFISTIGRIVTEKVVNDMVKWRKDGNALKKVAINYSNGQLLDDGYVDFLRRLLDENKIPPEFVEIEITENLFMSNDEKVRGLFDELNEIGVGLALDDFGTGYSSLSYLTFIPAQSVKIDKSLVDNYLVEGKESFIDNIVQLVHDLGMKLTVEGVEQKWQYDKLAEMKCDYIQGYFFSKPILAEYVPQFSVTL